jgi:hypothetical protein
MLSGFRINPDGSLAPVAGSPVVMDEPVRAIAAVNGSLIVAGRNSVNTFAVGRETGSLRLTDSARIPGVLTLVSDPVADTVIAMAPTGGVTLRVAQGKLMQLPAPVAPAKSQSPEQAILDATGGFMYEIESGAAELRAFRVESKDLTPLAPASYPLPGGATSIVLVQPTVAQR